MDDGEQKDFLRGSVGMLMVEPQGPSQEYYSLNNYGNNAVDANGTVLLYNPTQMPGSLSLMVSSEAA